MYTLKQRGYLLIVIHLLWVFSSWWVLCREDGSRNWSPLSFLEWIIIITKIISRGSKDAIGGQRGYLDSKINNAKDEHKVSCERDVKIFEGELWVFLLTESFVDWEPYINHPNQIQDESVSQEIQQASSVNLEDWEFSNKNLAYSRSFCDIPNKESADIKRYIIGRTEDTLCNNQ